MGDMSKQSASVGGVDALKAIFREASAEELKRSISDSALLITSEIPYKGPVYGHNLTFILLAGPALRASLKIFYGNVEARKFTSIKFKKNEEQVTESLSADFMKEFANLAAGSVKRTLGKMELSVGLGLPLSTRGFDDVFASDGLSEGVYADKWCLASQYGKITCMVTIKVLEDKNVSKISWSEASNEGQASEESEMEFL